MEFIDSKQYMDIQSMFIANSTTRHKFLVVEDIFKVAKIADKYVYYNNLYGSFHTSLLQAIIWNDNPILIRRLPVKMVQFVKDIVGVFKHIEIEKDKNVYDLKSYIIFSIISKKLLKQYTSTYSGMFNCCIPYTNVRIMVQKIEKNIKRMLEDVFMYVYGYKYVVDIVLPVSYIDVEISEYKKKAYEIAGISLPMLK